MIRISVHFADNTHQSKQRSSDANKPSPTATSFASWRERVLIFSTVCGIVFFCYIIVIGSPAWILVQIKEQNKLAMVRKKAIPASLQAQIIPDIKLIASPTPLPIPSPEITATPTPFPTPEIVASPIPTPATPSTQQSGFYVIGLASREEASAQIEAQKQREAGLNPQVVFSSNWSGLTPNYYQVVYGIFANRADTAALRKELERRGIKTYVMHSGHRVHH